jgi:diguanylate cyclase (GGDEF)-like protein/PAS domain S-box-containing protein
MPELQSPECGADGLASNSEVRRLNKIIKALMDRAERSTSAQGSEFGLFQTSIMLEEQVRNRTAELEDALRENEKINRALHESEARFRGVVSQSLVGIYIIEDGTFSYSNAKFNEIFGYDTNEVRSLKLVQIAAEADRPLVAENIRKRLSGEVDRVDYVFRGLRKNGSEINVEIHSSAMEIGGKLALIGLVMDVTERTRVEREVQALQERMYYQSTHDALTGLRNRRFLEETLSRELILVSRIGQPVSVIMGDLDHFKAINDCYGHLGGDEVLRVFGELIKKHVRASDICCRYGGEEFLLVLPQTSKVVAVERAELLRGVLAEARIANGALIISVTASFGVATSPGDGQTGDELIAAADGAMYVAKTAGRNCVKACPGRIQPVI